MELDHLDLGGAGAFQIFDEGAQLIADTGHHAIPEAAALPLDVVGELEDALDVLPALFLFGGLQFLQDLFHGEQVFLRPLQIVAGHVGDDLFGAGQGGGVHGAGPADLDLGLQGGRRIDESHRCFLSAHRSSPRR